jgi:POT family proton-dependent oligopeptide transporter
MLAPVSQKTLLGHPAGLCVLFLTEMWERFSFYGMRALLVYYMTKQLLFTQEHSSLVYGLYTGLVYFTTFWGGVAADRWFGRSRCVVAGGLAMALGHFLMAFESLFFPALILIILGNGAFKPNISAQVGDLYAPGDPRRDRAFSIFYVGINLGAFFAPLACGTLGELWGWHYGFGAAGLGMVAGLAVYCLGRPFLPREVRDPDTGGHAPAPAPAPGSPEAVDERRRITGLLGVCLLVVLFWTVYEQSGNTMALWFDGSTDRMVLGWEMPASWFQAMNPFLIFALTPLVTGLWAWLSARGREPSSAAKICLGLFLTGASFLILILPAVAQGIDDSPLSLFWPVANTVLLTLGELHLSPVGLSLVTKLAPRRMVSMFMGVWFLAQFAGNTAAGLLGGLWEVLPRWVFFSLLTGLACFAGLLVLAALRPLNRCLAVGVEGAGA